MQFCNKVSWSFITKVVLELCVKSCRGVFSESGRVVLVPKVGVEFCSANCHGVL